MRAGPGRPALGFPFPRRSIDWALVPMAGVRVRMCLDVLMSLVAGAAPCADTRPRPVEI